ncbi:MAG: hypothetical protein ACLVLD_30685 [Hungatella sp.]|uniref:hypothetical protein n=1 Tax=Hungatella sp. TaxID=2613924 RepID=UPI00399B936C
MKKGKQNHSNIIAVTALSLLCVGILGGAFLLNRSPEPVLSRQRLNRPPKRHLERT